MRPIEAKPPGRLVRAAKWVRRRPVHAALIATLALSVPTFAAIGTRAVQHRAAARQARIGALLGDARWLEERRRYEEVLDRSAQVLDIDEGNSQALAFRAMARFQMAPPAGAPAAPLREQALADVSRLVERQPERSWPHAMKAYMLHGLKREEEARAEEALAARYRAEPPSDEDLAEEARLAHSRKEYARAVGLFSELMI